MERVHVLKQKLGLENNQWTEASPEYQQAAVLVSRRRYQRCLDELEALVVSRVFELTKMNMSQTGATFFFVGPNSINNHVRLQAAKTHR